MAERDALLKIRALVERDDAAEAIQWDRSDDCELDAEIETYRSAVQFLLSKRPTVASTLLEGAKQEIPPHSVPILADVRRYDWRRLYRTTQFDAILMDPPWQLATSNPTRGVALSYGQLTNKDIMNIPIPKLQSRGLLFLWVINASFDFAMSLFDHWGYRIIDEVTWVKLTVNRRLAKSHGYYLQHAKEVCLVGMKGTGPENLKKCDHLSDAILSERRGQSQKPDEIYDLIEQLVPHGKYLEIFARRNNLRNHWVSLGNEVIDAPSSF